MLSFIEIAESGSCFGTIIPGGNSLNGEIGVGKDDVEKGYRNTGFYTQEDAGWDS
jgi:hypothetical protein